MDTRCAHPAQWLATVTVAVAVLGAAVTTFATSRPASAPASATTRADRTTAQSTHAGRPT